MKIRQYDPEKDYDYVYNALKAEGLKKFEMRIGLDMMFILEDGFFSYRIGDRYPRLIHFVINKDKRSMKTARKMLKFFRRMVMEGGYLFYIVEVSKDTQYITRFIQYLKGVKFEEHEYSMHYYVPLFGRVKRG
jgi:hypothetical protein